MKCFLLDTGIASDFINRRQHVFGGLVQQVNRQVAAITFSLGNTTFVCSDSDLAAVPDLSVENWAIANSE